MTQPDDSCKNCTHVYDNEEGGMVFYDGCSLGVCPPFPTGSVDLTKIKCFLHQRKPNDSTQFLL